MTEHARRHAMKWSYVLAWSTKGINICSLFVLAKLLGPEAFGVAALAMTFVMFIEILVDSGMMMAIVQRKDLEPRDLDSIFWLTVALAALLSVAGFFSSDLLGHLIENKQVPQLFAALSPIIFIKGLTVVQMGLAQRTSAFKTLAIRSASAAAVGGIVGIVAACSGLGVWSLVAQHLASAVIAFAMLWRLVEWRPSMRFEWTRAISFFRFSSGVVNNQIAGFSSNHVDIFVVSALFGEAAVGILRLAMRIVNLSVDLLVRPVQMIAVPRLAALQHDPDALRAEALLLLRNSTMIMLPAMAALAVSAELLSPVLGARWKDAETAVRILTLIGVVKSVTLLCGPTMLALGRSHTVAIGSWLQCAITAMTVIGAGMLARESEPSTQVDAIAWARAATFTLCVAPIQLFFLTRGAGVPLHLILRAISPAMAVAFLALGAGLAAHFSATALGANDLLRGSAAAVSSIAIAALVSIRTRRAAQRRHLKSKPSNHSPDSSQTMPPLEEAIERSL